MKKNFVIIFLFAVLLASCLILTSCHKHEVSEWTEIYDLTCVRAGTGIGFCECGEQITKEIQPIGHQYVNKVCSVCGDLEGSYGLQIEIDGSYASVVGIGTCTDTDIIIPSTYVTDDNKFLEVNRISSRAFENCTNIKTIIIPDSVSTISSDAFEGCSIERATIPADVCGAIKNNNLKEIVITGKSYFPSYIHSEAFSGCINLEKVIIGECVTSIGSDAFSGCINLEKVIIGENVNSIYSGAFANCSSLQNISIPSGVTCINGATFSGCTSLSDIIIPENVTVIGYSAFQGCSSLSSVTIPNGVTSIESWAFSDCSNLSRITIPESVTNIGTFAFKNCNSITDITIPGGVTSLGVDFFRGCTGLKYVTICEGVTSIASSAFQYCVSLERVIIPSSVTTISGSPFKACANLTIYCEAQSKPEGWDALWNWHEDNRFLEVVWGYQGELNNNE